jgi:hypothetical protein
MRHYLDYISDALKAGMCLYVLDPDNNQHRFYERWDDEGLFLGYYLTENGSIEESDQIHFDHHPGGRCEKYLLLPETANMLATHALREAVKSDILSFKVAYPALREQFGDKLTFWALRDYRLEEKDRGAFMIRIPGADTNIGPEPRMLGYMVDSGHASYRIDKHTVAEWRFHEINATDWPILNELVNSNS